MKSANEAKLVQQAAECQTDFTYRARFSWRSNAGGETGGKKNHGAVKHASSSKITMHAASALTLSM